eukprot:TRINITY_DN10536_c0_g2_i1.p1 TRINITY_DN10536_c0_g2~~TRINITY_DN10536_c0_g2_i1.p1  ORF type:complete len:638 (+),score=208.51 TRINITY_DN10536_c0_g2_i1:99-2012(+)
MDGLDGARSGSSKDFFLKMKAAAEAKTNGETPDTSSAAKAPPPAAAKPKKAPVAAPPAKPKPKAPPAVTKKPVAAPPPAAKPKPKLDAAAAAQEAEKAAEEASSAKAEAAAQQARELAERAEKEAAEKEAAEQAEKEAAEAAEKAEREAEEAAAAAEEEEEEVEPEPEPEPEEEKPKVVTHRCKAIMGHKGKDGELTFNKDDIIFVLTPDLSSKMLKGVFNGSTGMFPGHAVENTADNKRCGDPSMHFKMGVKCRALGNYNARSAKELSFKQGDTLFITVMNNNAMLQAVFNGKAGLVPRQFVVDAESAPELDAPKPTEELKAVGIAKCVAIRSHYSNRAGWLDFDIGDSVMVPKKTDGKVWQGVFKGNVGKLRSEFVVDTADFTEDQIKQMVDKAKASKTPKTSSQPSPARSAPVSATRAPPKASPAASNDPFAPTVDPFAASGGDPFAASPSAAAQGPPSSQPASGGARRGGRGRPGSKKQMLGALDASAFEQVSAAPTTAVTPLPVKSVLASKPAAGSDPFAAPSGNGENDEDAFAALAREPEVVPPLDGSDAALDDAAVAEALNGLDLEGLADELADDDDEDGEEQLGEESVEAFDDGAEDEAESPEKDKKQLKAEAKKAKKEAKLKRKSSKK